MKTRKPINEAIDRLAALYPLGALTACTAPARFIDEVAEDVRSLRREHAEILALLREWRASMTAAERAAWWARVCVVLIGIDRKSVV